MNWPSSSSLLSVKLSFLCLLTTLIGGVVDLFDFFSSATTTSEFYKETEKQLLTNQYTPFMDCLINKNILNYRYIVYVHVHIKDVPLCSLCSITYSMYIKMILKLGRASILVLPYKEIALLPHLILVGCYKIRYGLPHLNLVDSIDHNTLYILI